MGLQAYERSVMTNTNTVTVHNSINRSRTTDSTNWESGGECRWRRQTLKCGT